MLVHPYSIHRRARRAVRSLRRFALCSVFMLGSTALQANELSYNQISAGVGVGGDFVDLEDGWNTTKEVKELSFSVEVGEKTFIEIAGASGNTDIVAVSVGGFSNTSASGGVYGQIGVLFDTSGSGELGLAAAFGMRKLLSPYIELSPSLSVTSLVNQRESYGYYDEGSSTSAAIALAIRFYPVKYISIDLLGVASQDVSGTMLSISGHF